MSKTSILLLLCFVIASVLALNPIHWKKMCEDKNVNDAKMEQFQEELDKCEKDDCFTQDNDFPNKFTRHWNRRHFAMRCSKKYHDCERKMLEKEQKEPTEEEQKKIDKKLEDESKAFVVISIFKLFFICVLILFQFDFQQECRQKAFEKVFGK